MRRPALLTLVGIAAAVIGFIAPSAQAAAGSEAQYAARLLTLVNNARAEHGLPALQLASGTTDVAAGWTAHLAAAGALSHNPDLRRQLEDHGSANWSIYGENVGQGSAGDADGLFRAYMQSPEHRDNILTRAYRYVGVAVVFTGSKSWNTFDFVDTYGQAAPAPTTTKTHVAHKVQSTATRPTAAPAPQRAASPKPATHIEKPQPVHHEPARTHKPRRVHVQGVRSVATAATPLTGDVVAISVVQDAAPAPLPGSSRETAIVIAVAVLALAAAARRWTILAVTR